nr:MAG TPA: hypothetical protein [Caudoviricetes sp.]
MTWGYFQNSKPDKSDTNFSVVSNSFAQLSWLPLNTKYTLNIYLN